MQQTACLVVNPVTVDSYSSLIAWWPFEPQAKLWPLHKAFTTGLGLDAMSPTWPAMVQHRVFFHTGWQCL